MKFMFFVRIGALSAVAALAQTAHADGRDWARWVQRQIAELPANRAIDAERDKALAESRAKSQPLYNPELSFGYENATETTATVGLSQTLDWSGKASSAGRLGRAFDQAAGLRAERTRARLTADALNALISYDAAQARLAAACEQEKNLEALNDLVRRREAGGDLGAIDAQVAYLSMGNAQQTLAQEEAAVITANADLKSVLATDQLPPTLPAPGLWQSPAASATPDDHVTSNYDFRLSEAALSLAARQAELTRKKRRPDPTLGLEIGRESDDTLWALKFSVPLPVRRTGGPEYRAALAESDRRQYQFARTRDEIRARLEGRLAHYRTQRSRWQRWRQLVGKPLNEGGDLLERAWRQGEMTTQNYLQALDQRLKTRQAGLALREAMQRAWVEWLFESGQLHDWLDALASGTVSDVDG